MARKTQPAGSDWTINPKAQLAVDTLLTQPGSRVGNNPQNLPMPGVAAYNQGNIYGDASRVEGGIDPVIAPPTSPWMQTLAPRWQDGVALEVVGGRARQLPMTAAPSPLQQLPNELVMNAEMSPSVVEGLTGYQSAAPLPPAPQLDWGELAQPAAPTAYQPLYSSQMEFADYRVPNEVHGRPSDATFPPLPRFDASQGDGSRG